ncbi:uncharacterized protein BCR38DRAFT_508885 [Pseudomassariella vexata]|uniref:Uncharacterized protein n=1 Tax=Pseudomassariella vexata TaxID=1141098 RepID=A0A1Y2D711_9PEZI|nr:uncharacterized protein BCR38DRAFT_508885 [Pseudomassariella vexata]ORY54987.1 hypothetical protein BCR38DRAFT_508885 [Pseudomassariella vexata]
MNSFASEQPSMSTSDLPCKQISQGCIQPETPTTLVSSTPQLYEVLDGLGISPAGAMSIATSGRPRPPSSASSLAAVDGGLLRVNIQDMGSPNSPLLPPGLQTPRNIDDEQLAAEVVSMRMANRIFEADMAQMRQTKDSAKGTDSAKRNAARGFSTYIYPANKTPPSEGQGHRRTRSSPAEILRAAKNSVKEYFKPGSTNPSSYRGLTALHPSTGEGEAYGGTKKRRRVPQQTWAMEDTKPPGHKRSVSAPSKLR